MAIEPATGTSSPEQRVKVFISYSRADKAFASDLVLGLAACGFAPYIDRHDIAAGEEWEKRLAGLIAEAHTVVYVISPDSLTSQHCNWELEETQRLSKRVLPVVWRPINEEAAPAALKRLNYIFFTGDGRTFAAGLAELAEALRTDIAWIREHTRLAEMAERWLARGRADALLLRGDDIDAARTWLDTRPARAPAISDAQSDFIKASSDARDAAVRRARDTRQRILVAVSFVAVAMTGLAAAAVWQWREAETQRSEAVAREALTRTLSDSNLRLSANIGLRTAPSGDGYFTLKPGWYLAVAHYSGAVAEVQRTGGGQPDTVSSGALIDGGLLHTRYEGQPLVIFPAGRAAAPVDLEDLASVSAPGDTLATDAERQPQAMATSNAPTGGDLKISTRFPTLDPDKRIAGAERIWRTPPHLGGEYPFEIWRLVEQPPTGARAIAEHDISCALQQANDNPGLVIGQFSVNFPDPRVGVGGDEAQLAISQVLVWDPRELSYTHATNRVAAGSPVLDFGSGKVLALHIGSAPDLSRPGRRQGYGYALSLALNIARAEMADEAFHPPPLCEG